MEKNRRNSKELAIWKWLALFAIVFTLALPVSAKPCKASSPDTYCVSVSSGYLALRTGKSFSSNNEIGQLYSGDMVTVSDYSDSTYWYVYSSKYNQYGYVNKNYLVYNGSAAATSSVYTVSVSKGYLALRSDSSYNPANEIGELYNGDTVEVQNAAGAYWYVYSYKLGQYGYVDQTYLVSGGAAENPAGGYAGSGDTRTVSVTKGYLALRSAKAYNDANEIGKLYSGDTVQLMDSSDSTYWYVYAPSLGKNGYVNKAYLF